MKSAFIVLLIVTCIFTAWWNREREKRYVQLAEEVIALNEDAISLRGKLNTLRRELDARPVAKDMSEEVAALVERVEALEKQDKPNPDISKELATLKGEVDVLVKVTYGALSALERLNERITALEQKAKGKRAFAEGEGDGYL